LSVHELRGCLTIAVSRLSLNIAVVWAAISFAAAFRFRSPAATGRIQGTVLLSPALSARKPRIRLYGDYGPGALPAPPRPATSEFANVVIYLDSVPATGDPAGVPPTRLAIEQHDEVFAPHVLPVLRGSTVEFPNRDPVFHNVFSLSSSRSFDLGRYPKGASKSVRFDRSGTVQVFCHIHSDMSAVVLVLDNPFFTLPVAPGRYTIDDVPVGEYRLVAWHERIKPIVRRVRVRAGETTNLDLNVPLPPSAEAAGR
jgi:plastocyanin